MKELPRKPVFVSPYREVSGGVDFLSLREVNLSLMNSFLPGINNVTNHLRPYSVICWMAWMFKKAFEESGEQERSSTQYSEFQEKVEVLFGWSHQLHDAGVGMPGNAQECPAEGGMVPLDFESWKRTPSWLDPVFYGPSLKIDNGMGFLRQIGSDVFVPTAKGSALATALDEQLMGHELYPMLCSMDDHLASVDQALGIYDTWRIDISSPTEKKVFRESFFKPEDIGLQTRDGSRSAAIALILESLEGSKPQSIDEIRQNLVTSSFLPGNYPADGLVRARSLWRVLQLRQAHRLALEVLFSWVEWQLLVNGLVDSQGLVSALSDLLANDPNPIAQDKTISDVIKREYSSGYDQGKLIEQVKQMPRFDFFNQIERLVSLQQSDRDQSAIEAVKLAILCAVIAKDLEHDDAAVIHLKVGGTPRVSLKKWSDFVYSHANTEMTDFLMIVVENFLLSQHFGTAAMRYSVGKQRLRITIEDSGLTSLLPGPDSVWHPRVTPDRLASAISLMVDCDLLVSSVENGRQLYSI